MKDEWDKEFHALSKSEFWNVVIADFCRAKWRLATRWQTVQIPSYLATEHGKYYMHQRYSWVRWLSQAMESNFRLLSKLEVHLQCRWARILQCHVGFTFSALSTFLFVEMIPCGHQSIATQTESLRATSDSGEKLFCHFRIHVRFWSSVSMCVFL